MSAASLKQTISRRKFFRNTGLALAGALAFPYIVPARALGLNGTISPSNRIVLGALGMGQGHFNMSRFLEMSDVQVVAVCDLHKKNLEKGLRAVREKHGNNDARGYNDYREMFAGEKLDAVMLAAPDHWHALHAVAAARAGIDIFGEKPLAHTLAEGRAICDAVRDNNIVWQTGSWQRSIPIFRQAVELVRNGRIGKISRIEVGTFGGYRTGEIVPPAHNKKEQIPAGLDYDLWVGPAAWQNYDSRLVHNNWRWNLKFGGGRLIDWVGHHVDIAHWAMDLDSAGPEKITGSGEFGTDEIWNAEHNYHYACTYAGGLRIDVGSKFAGGVKFFGKTGWLFVTRGKLEASYPKILQKTPRDNEPPVYRSDDHWRNFIDCVKDRRTTITPVETAHRSASIGHLGHIAIRTGRVIHWNPATEEITNDAGATAMLTPQYRDPWKFPI